jgi:hypothetical protein
LRAVALDGRTKHVYDPAEPVTYRIVIEQL